MLDCYLTTIIIEAINLRFTDRTKPSRTLSTSWFRACIETKSRAGRSTTAEMARQKVREHTFTYSWREERKL